MTRRTPTRPCPPPPRSSEPKVRSSRRTSRTSRDPSPRPSRRRTPRRPRSSLSRTRWPNRTSSSPSSPARRRRSRRTTGEEHQGDPDQVSPGRDGPTGRAHRQAHPREEEGRGEQQEKNTKETQIKSLQDEM